MTWHAVALVGAWHVLTCCPILATLARYSREPGKKKGTFEFWKHLNFENLAHSSTSCSQVDPVQVSGHWQKKPLNVSTQLPPFLTGFSFNIYLKQNSSIAEHLTPFSPCMDLTFCFSPAWVRLLTLILLKLPFQSRQTDFQLLILKKFPLLSSSSPTPSFVRFLTKGSHQ